MLPRLLIAVGYLSVSASGLFAQEASNRVFQAITLESDVICRAWLIPTDPTLAHDRLKSKQIPISFVEDLGLILLSGQMRFRDAITIEELVVSQKIDGLDLSYIDLNDDELERVAQCRSLKHLYLSGVKLTDEMIDSIGQMSQLEYLNLFGTNLTANQIVKLSARIPAAKIEATKPDGLPAACDGYFHLVLNQRWKE